MDNGTIQKLENLLLIAVPRDLLDDEVLQLRRDVLQAIRRHRSRWVLLDFSLVDICDSFFGRFIQSMAQMAALMGAEVIVSGLHDSVVETLIGLGMTLPDIHAVLDLDDALALSRSMKSGNSISPMELGSTLAFDQADIEQATWLNQSLTMDIDGAGEVSNE